MARILLHIGEAKTGTTALQRFLRANAARLAELGFHIHSADAPNNFGNNNSFVEIRKAHLDGDHAKAVSLSRNMLDGLSDSLLNIISAEAACKLSPELVSEIFEGHDLKVVRYIRQDCDALTSYYLQWLQALENTPDLDTLVANQLEHYDRSRSLDLWTDVFGENHMVCLYGPRHLHNGDSVEDFLTRHLACPMDAAFRFFTGQVNPSLSYKTAALKQHINAHPEEYRHFLDSPRQQRYLALERLSPAHPGRFRLPKRFKAQLTPFFEAQQSVWGPKYFGRDRIFDYENHPYAEAEYVQPKEERLALSAQLSELLSDPRHNAPHAS